AMSMMVHVLFLFGGAAKSPSAPSGITSSTSIGMLSWLLSLKVAQGSSTISMGRCSAAGGAGAWSDAAGGPSTGVAPRARRSSITSATIWGAEAVIAYLPRERSGDSERQHEGPSAW